MDERLGSGGATGDHARVSARKTAVPTESSPAAAQSTQTAASQLVRALVAAGVDTFFGIPGGPVSPVFDAVLSHSAAHLVESRHEASAAFSAAGYHRACGRVPAVIVTAGPGATNAVTGIVSAHLSRTPMLVICGDVAWAASGGRLLQDTGPEGIAIEQMLSKVTRGTFRVTQGRSASAQALAALQAATNPLDPGPALLVVPIHLAAAPGAADLKIERTRVRLSAAPTSAALNKTLDLLSTGEHPLVVVGSGCRDHVSAVRELIGALGVPFVTTPQAKGLISEAHPLSLRHGGLAASKWARAYTSQGVDVTLVLGTDLDDCSVGPTPYTSKDGTLIHVDLDATVFNRNALTTLAIEADVGEFATELRELVHARGFENPSATPLLQTIRATSAFDEPDFATDSAPVLAPHRAVADLERAVAADAVFVTDIGEHMLFALHYLTAERPDRFNIFLGLGSMGSGIAGSVGIALADARRTVVCICGDGGMQMNGMEALTAIRERLPIVFAVFNDARYNMVYHGFKQVFGREESWDTAWIDFKLWGESLGMPGARIDAPGQITPALISGLLSAGGPCVLDIRINRDLRFKGGGRNEALLHMSMMDKK